MKLIETHIQVEDVEKSLSLYKSLISHKEILRWADGHVAALVLNDGSALGLWGEGHKGIHDGQGGTNVHFAFKIDDDEYDVYKNKIIKAGLEALEYQWESGHRSVYFFDYDGHQGEFITGNWIELNNL